MNRFTSTESTQHHNRQHDVLHDGVTNGKLLRLALTI